MNDFALWSILPELSIAPLDTLPPPLEELPLSSDSAHEYFVLHCLGNDEKDGLFGTIIPADNATPENHPDDK
jgi:hypothetical protein